MSDPRPTPETDAQCDKAQFDSRQWYDFARKLERERDTLARWKEEQMFVESQWDAQAVGKELGMVVGTDIRRNILPSIVRLKQERDEARAEIERMNLLASSVAGIVAKQQAMAEVIKESYGTIYAASRSLEGSSYQGAQNTLAKLQPFIK